MNLNQAQSKVAQTNPNAVWVVTSTFKGQPDTFKVMDYTYTDEFRVCINEFDVCTGDLIEGSGI